MARKTKLYLGIDIGSISTKGVALDKNNRIHAQSYLWTEGNPIKAVKEVLRKIERQLKGKNAAVVSVGTTGSARELIGAILDAALVKNEITAHAVGTLTYHPNVRTIFEIGGQDSKIIILDQGIVVDYAMNTLCAAGTGAFLASQARRLNIPVEEFGKYALRSSNPTKIAGRCTVFAESDLVHKAQMGYQTRDIIAGLCNSIVYNYLNNVAKGKNVESPIVFQGGVSKNVGVIKSFEKITVHKIMVDKLGHLMGAIGVAILVREQRKEGLFNFDAKDTDFRTIGIECGGCPNNCEIICALKDGQFLDAWGNRCPNGIERVQAKLKQMNEAGQDKVKKQVFQSKLVKKTKVALNTMEFTFSKPKGFSYSAGQFIFLGLPKLKDKGIKESNRAMSLSSAPYQKSLSVCMRMSDSLFKRTIEKIELGEGVEIEGPEGNITINQRDKRPVVLLAGGIGAAPFRGIIRDEQKRGWPRQIYFFYCDKTPQQTAFLKEFKEIKSKNFKFIPTMTRLKSSDKQWKGERGRITPQMIKKHLPDIFQPLYYIVGLPSMVADTHKMLKKMAIKPEQVKIELFTGYEKV
jgi:predicted CoA-substrate-specific enzyme activase